MPTNPGEKNSDLVFVQKKMSVKPLYKRLLYKSVVKFVPGINWRLTPTFENWPVRPFLTLKSRKEEQANAVDF